MIRRQQEASLIRSLWQFGTCPESTRGLDLIYVGICQCIDFSGGQSEVTVSVIENKTSSFKLQSFNVEGFMIR